MSLFRISEPNCSRCFWGTVSYGCLGEPQAPGQIHVKELKTIIILRKHVVYIEMSSISAYN